MFRYRGLRDNRFNNKIYLLSNYGQQFAWRPGLNKPRVRRWYVRHHAAFSVLRLGEYGYVHSLSVKAVVVVLTWLIKSQSPDETPVTLGGQTKHVFNLVG